MTGFDIDLVRDLARRLGVQVEFRDFVFDGLLNAVRVRQVDMAIGAISVTPGRQEVVRFSDVYYVSEDAILALEASDPEVGSIIDLAGHKLAVQKGSVYDTWVQLLLVDTEEIPSTDVIKFVEAEDGIDLLRSETADLAIMDYQPALEFARDDDIKIVAHGLNRQLYGIAMPTEATTLAFEVNRALKQLSEDGQIGALAGQYMGLRPGDMIPVSPSSEPATEESTAEPPSSGCIDSMALVEELTEPVPELAPGETFTRTFRVRNAGTCDWDESYMLDFGGGNVDDARMGGEPIRITDGAASGETYDLELELTAPDEEGDYQAFWNMVDPRGATFGERIYISLTVVE
jgi:polar amino acid transport system substrate-binding protein